METEKGDRTKSSWSIPLDITIEVLSRLPAKSVVRFRCVSKLWSSITTTPHFYKSFATHSPARPCLLLVLVKKEEDKRVFYSLPHHQDPQRFYTRVEKYEMMLPKQDPKYHWLHDGNFVQGRVFSSIRGLICFGDSDQVVIWNPTLRQHVVLPDPELSRPLINYLGYDPVEDKYKVLCMSGCVALARTQKPRVITLGAKESWRTTKEFSRGRPWDINRRVYGGICMNGVIVYYRDEYNILEYFDVRSEEFGQILMPKEVSTDRRLDALHVITSYHGRLAWLHYMNKVWVLIDPKKNQWSDDFRYSYPDPYSIPRMDGFRYHLPFDGMTDYEEMICRSGPFYRPFYAYYHDFKKNTTRWVAYEGFVEEHSGNFDNFPNHIENLMSLESLF